MTYILEVSELAEADFAHAVRWYGQIRSGLAPDFVLCVDEAVDRIMHNPLAYAPFFLNTRRAVVRRFPYGVIYRVCDTRSQNRGVLPRQNGPDSFTPPFGIIPNCRLWQPHPPPASADA